MNDHRRDIGGAALEPAYHLTIAIRSYERLKQRPGDGVDPGGGKATALQLHHVNADVHIEPPHPDHGRLAIESGPQSLPQVARQRVPRYLVDKSPRPLLTTRGMTACRQLGDMQGHGRNMTTNATSTL